MLYRLKLRLRRINSKRATIGVNSLLLLGVRDIGFRVSIQEVMHSLTPVLCNVLNPVIRTKADALDPFFPIRESASTISQSGNGIYM